VFAVIGCVQRELESGLPDEQPGARATGHMSTHLPHVKHIQ
jgi:hypothetical protein